MYAVKLDSLEAYCAEPGCMKYFSNEQCLKEHIRSCHQYILCDTCGTKQLKKNIKRHMRMHEADLSSGRIGCSVKGCSLTFSTVSSFLYSLVDFQIIHYLTSWRVSNSTSSLSCTDIESQSAYKGCALGTQTICLRNARLQQEIYLQTCEGQS